MFNNKGKETK